MIVWIGVGMGLIELGIGLIELGIGLIEFGKGLIELRIGRMELGIGLRINNARRTVLARVSGLVQIRRCWLSKLYPFRNGIGMKTGCHEFENSLQDLPVFCFFL